MTTADVLTVPKGPPRSWSERLLSSAALVIGLALALPALTIIVLAAMPTENVWPHLISTVLPGYIVAYAYVDFLSFAGPLQTWLRAPSSSP